MYRGVGLDKRIISLVLVLIFLIGGVFAASITINNGATYTTSTSVTATLAGLSGDTNYCIVTTDSNTGCSWTNTTETDLNVASTIENTEGLQSLYLFTNQQDTKDGFDAITLDSVAPTVTYSIPDGNSFRASNLPANITVTTDGATSTVVYLDGTSAGTTNGANAVSTSGIYDGTHTILTDANDAAGNNLNTSMTFKYDTNAPSTISATTSYTTDYTNDETPIFTLSASDAVSGMTGGTVYLSCAPSGTWKSFTYATSYSDFDITSTTYDCNTAEGSRAVFAKFKDLVGNESSVTSTIVRYDNTSSNSPSGLSASTAANQVTLNWTAPSADNLSGVASYNILKNGDIVTTTTNTSVTISNLSNGVSYTFKVQAVDGAGNLSGYSSSVDAVPNETSFDSSVNVQRSGSEVTYVQDGDDLTVSCTLEFESDNVRIKYRYNNGTTQNLSNEEDNTTSISADLTVDGAYNEIDFWCNWTYNGANSDSSLATVYIDSEQPSVTWPNDFNTIFSGSRGIEVEVTDNKSVSMVEFLFDGVKRGTTKNGNTYSYTLDSTEFNNGTYTLTVIAKDAAGNEKESSKTIAVNNTLSEDAASAQAISKAKIAKANVEDLMNYFINEGLAFSLELTTKKDNADILLVEAEAEIDLAFKQSKAESAEAEYIEISNSANVETIESKTITFTEEGAIEQLLALGLSAEKAEELKNKLINGNVERKISIVKIGSEYRAQVQITLTVDTDEATYKLVEVIPKELAMNASEIFSELEFNIIENDPVIEFIVPAGVTSITYSIGNLDEDKKRLIADGNIASKFSFPPILLGAEEDSRTIIAPALDIVFLAAAGIIIVIIAIVVIIGVVLMSKGQKDGPGPVFGHTTKKSSFGGINIKKNNKPKAGDGKWKYNG
jgi:hypothetical protein